MNAYLLKELRETARWLPLAWLIIGGLLYVALPQMMTLYLTQGLAERVVFQIAIGGSLVAFGLGLAQFMLDQRSSARAFLATVSQQTPRRPRNLCTGRWRSIDAADSLPKLDL